ncbi:MAG TPA: SigE family RNA polymerase sigma factor [Mycobacteriales bacterium]|nr:SigE family RNA polymerase sigma factor [Mycobacteriales bacterium]
MRQPDEEAFAAFVRARSGALLSTAWALTRDKQLAEDLVQTALARCYAAWPRIESDDPEAYVRRTMLNAQRNVWRRRLPVLVWPGELPEPTLARPFDDDVAEREAVLTALRALSPRQRAVVVYRYYEDRPDDQIAQLMGCSVGSVKRHGARALRRLERHASLRDGAPVTRMRSRAVT